MVQRKALTITTIIAGHVGDHRVRSHSSDPGPPTRHLLGTCLRSYNSDDQYRCPISPGSRRVFSRRSAEKISEKIFEALPGRKSAGLPPGVGGCPGTRGGPGNASHCEGKQPPGVGGGLERGHRTRDVARIYWLCYQIWFSGTTMCPDDQLLEPVWQFMHTSSYN